MSVFTPAQQRAIVVIKALHESNPLDICAGGITGAGVHRNTLYALLRMGVLTVRKASERVNRHWSDTYYNLDFSKLEGVKA